VDGKAAEGRTTLHVREPRVCGGLFCLFLGRSLDHDSSTSRREEDEGLDLTCPNSWSGVDVTCVVVRLVAKPKNE
jgi:hypothetical protein